MTASSFRSARRLPKLRPTPEPAYDLWRQDERDLLVAGTRRMEFLLLDRLRVLTMIETGASRGELRGLRVADFDLYRKTVTVLGEGSKRRLIPVSSEVTNAIDEHLLTEYPLLERTPTATDYLWFPTYHVGER